MAEMLAVPFMRQALIAGLLLAALLGYLGVHVVRRRIVFVDLAIAQLSAVGVAAAAWLEQEPVLFSLLFTLAGAALLSLPARERRVPQEAVMGAVYAVASALVILLMAKSPHGEAELLGLLFGNILAVTGDRIRWLALLLLGIAMVQLIWGRHFRDDHQSGPAWRWNLLFYLTLAVVIAAAIRTAGVLMVFSDLVIPAIAAVMLTNRFLPQVLLAVAMGAAATLAGMYASFHYDLPTGSSLVAALGGL
ncbi:MAG: metal ABC transporter permease, partial [Nitrospirota bacterium]